MLSEEDTVAFDHRQATPADIGKGVSSGLRRLSVSSYEDVGHTASYQEALCCLFISSSNEDPLSILSELC